MKPSFCSQGKDCFSLGSLLRRDFFSLCNVWYLRENSWTEHTWITAKRNGMLGNMDCTVWLKRSALSLVPHGGVAGSVLMCACELLEGAGRGGRDGWDEASGPNKCDVRRLFASLLFPALMVLIWGEDWIESTVFWFGEVVGDHVKQQVLMGQTDESLAQTTAV